MLGCAVARVLLSAFVVLLLASPVSVSPAAAADGWVITPVPTPTIEAVNGAITQGQQAALIYEEVRFTNAVLLFFLSLAVVLLAFSWLRVRVR